MTPDVPRLVITGCGCQGTLTTLYARPPTPDPDPA